MPNLSPSMRTFFISLFTLLGASVGMVAQEKLTTEEYIEKYKDIAIAEMYRTGIPASITLSQGILESGSGNSRLAVEANNHFGIKCHEWTGDYIRKDDDLKDECFRKYADDLQSYYDHSEFLMTRSRYAFLFSYDKTDYKKWARGLKKAGYATNPKYAPLLIGLIERYELYQYDHSSMPEIAYKPITNKNDPVALKKGTPKKMYTTGKFENNRIETVILQPNQDLADVAKAYDTRVKRLERYNETDDGYQLVPGMKVYLQPKRNKAAVRSHTVKDGETMFLISQNYGIKLEKLYERNLMEWGSQPEVGSELRLRGKRNEPPQLAEGRPLADDDSFFKDVVQAINPFHTTDDEINKPDHPQPKPKPSLPDEEAGEPTPKADAPADQPVPEQARVDSSSVVNNESESYEPYDEQRPKYQYEQQEKRELGEEKDKVKDKMQDDISQEVHKQPVNKETILRHTVSEGETLYGISRKYDVSMAHIKQWNDLKGTELQIGQTLIVGKGK